MKTRRTDRLTDIFPFYKRTDACVVDNPTKEEIHSKEMQKSMKIEISHSLNEERGYKTYPLSQ